MPAPSYIPGQDAASRSAALQRDRDTVSKANRWAGLAEPIDPVADVKSRFPGADAAGIQAVTEVAVPQPVVPAPAPGGRIAQAGKSILKGISSGIGGIADPIASVAGYGSTSDFSFSERRRSLNELANQALPTEDTITNAVAEGIGGMVPVIASGPGAWVTLGTQGLTAGKDQAESLRGRGVDVGSGQEAGLQALHGATGAVMGKFAPGLATKTGEAVLAKTGSKLLARAAVPAAGAAEMAAMNFPTRIVSNLAERGLGAETPVMEGTGRGAIVDVATGGILTAPHITSVGRPKAAKTADSAKPAAPAPRPAGEDGILHDIQQRRANPEWPLRLNPTEFAATARDWGVDPALRRPDAAEQIRRAVDADLAETEPAQTAEPAQSDQPTAAVPQGKPNVPTVDQENVGRDVKEPVKAIGESATVPEGRQEAVPAGEGQGQGLPDVRQGDVTQRLPGVDADGLRALGEVNAQQAAEQLAVQQAAADTTASVPTLPPPRASTERRSLGVRPSDLRPPQERQAQRVQATPQVKAAPVEPLVQPGPSPVLNRAPEAPAAVAAVPDRGGAVDVGGKVTPPAPAPPVVSKTETTGTGKDPSQMTRAEWNAAGRSDVDVPLYNLDRYLAAELDEGVARRAIKLLGGKTPERGNANDELRRIQEKNAHNLTPWREAIHRAFIESDVAAGKPVPAEVLADYPELAKPVTVPPVTDATGEGRASPDTNTPERPGNSVKEMSAALERYDETGNLNIRDKEAIESDRNLDSAAKKMLGEIPGVTKVAKTGSSMGSRYYDVVYTDSSGDEASLQIRVSNHKQGQRGSESAWSFDVGDSEKSIQSGLDTIAKKIADDSAPASPASVEPAKAPEPAAVMPQPEEPPPAEPPKPPKPVATAPEKPNGDTVAIKRAAVTERTGREESLLPSPEPMKEVSDRAAAVRKADPKAGEDIVTRLNADPNAAISKVDGMVLLDEQRQHSNQVNKWADIAADTARSDKERADAREEIKKLDAQQDRIDFAANAVSRHFHDVGMMLQQAKNADFSLATLRKRLRAAKGGELTPEEEAAVAKQASDYAEGMAVEEARKARDQAAVDAGMAEYDKIEAAKREAEAAQALADQVVVLKVKEKRAKKAREADPYLDAITEGDEAAQRLREKYGGKKLSEIDAGPEDIPDVEILYKGEKARLTKQTGKAPKKSVVEDRLRTMDLSIDVIRAAADAVEGTPPKPAPTPAERRSATTARLKSRMDAGKETPGSVSNAARRLARSFVEEDITISREALVDKVHAELKAADPTITREEARDAISGYGMFTPAPTDPVSIVLADYRGQLQAQAGIEEVAGGNLPKSSGWRSNPPSDILRQMRQEREAVIKASDLEATDEGRLKSAVQRIKTSLENRIADLDKQIADRERTAKASPREITGEARAEIDALKALRSERQKVFQDVFREEITAENAARIKANYSRSLERRLKAWEAKKAAADFAEKPKPTREELESKQAQLTPEDIANLVKIQNLKDEVAQMREAYRLKNRTPFEKGRDRVYETINLPKAIKASWDWSAPYRQGIGIVLAHPVQAHRMFRDMFKAGFSEARFNEIDAKLRNRPGADFGNMSKLELTRLNQRMSAGEEAIKSDWSDYVPGVRASNRAFVTYLNSLRAWHFDHLVRGAESGGAKLAVAEGRHLAQLVNIASGRGQSKTLAQHFKTAGMLLWSPRLLLSRIQLLTGYPVWRGGTARTRKIVAGEYLRALGSLTALYSLAAIAKAALPDEDIKDVTFDPRSTDAGKIVIGSTRVDPLGGLAQVYTLLGRLASRQTKNPSGIVQDLTGDKKPYGGATWWGTVGKFALSKVSPTVSVPASIMTGEDYFGRPIDEEASKFIGDLMGEKPSRAVSMSAAVARETLLPLSLSDIVSAAQEHGIPRAFVLQAIGTFGAGVQTHSQGDKATYNFKQLKSEGDRAQQQFNDALKAKDWAEAKRLREKHGRAMAMNPHLEQIQKQLKAWDELEARQPSLRPQLNRSREALLRQFAGE